MKGLKIMTVMLLLLMVAMPMIPAGAELDITVATDGDVELEVSTGGDGALLSVDYNGRDLLEEIEQKIKTIADLRSTIVALSMRNDVEDLQEDIEELDVSLQKLVGELNMVLADLYSRLNSQAHIIGINPANNSVAITLIVGNTTVSDYLDEILIDLNATDREFISVRLQFENVSAGMMVHDTVLMETRSSVRELEDNTVAIIDFENAMAFLDDILAGILTTDVDLQTQIDIQGMDVEELRLEVSQVYQELMRERVTRNNLTIMFVAFSVLVILLSVVSSRK